MCSRGKDSRERKEIKAKGHGEEFNEKHGEGRR